MSAFGFNVPRITASPRGARSAYTFVSTCAIFWQCGHVVRINPTTTTLPLKLVILTTLPSGSLIARSPAGRGTAASAVRALSADNKDTQAVRRFTLPRYNAPLLLRRRFLYRRSLCRRRQNLLNILPQILFLNRIV